MFEIEFNDRYFFITKYIIRTFPSHLSLVDHMEGKGQLRKVGFPVRFANHWGNHSYLNLWKHFGSRSFSATAHSNSMKIKPILHCVHFKYHWPIFIKLTLWAPLLYKIPLAKMKSNAQCNRIEVPVTLPQLLRNRIMLSRGVDNCVHHLHMKALLTTKIRRYCRWRVTNLRWKIPLRCKQNLSSVNKGHAEFIYVYMIISLVC